MVCTMTCSQGTAHTVNKVTYRLLRTHTCEVSRSESLFLFGSGLEINHVSIWINGGADTIHKENSNDNIHKSH